MVDKNRAFQYQKKKKKKKQDLLARLKTDSFQGGGRAPEGPLRLADSRQHRRASTEPASFSWLRWLLLSCGECSIRPLLTSTAIFVVSGRCGSAYHSRWTVGVALGFLKHHMLLFSLIQIRSPTPDHLLWGHCLPPPPFLQPHLPLIIPPSYSTLTCHSGVCSLVPGAASSLLPMSNSQQLSEHTPTRIRCLQTDVLLGCSSGAEPFP